MLLGDIDERHKLQVFEKGGGVGWKPNTLAMYHFSFVFNQLIYFVFVFFLTIIVCIMYIVVCYVHVYVRDLAWYTGVRKSSCLEATPSFGIRYGFLRVCVVGV